MLIHRYINIYILVTRRESTESMRAEVRSIRHESKPEQESISTGITLMEKYKSIDREHGLHGSDGFSQTIVSVHIRVLCHPCAITFSKL